MRLVRSLGIILTVLIICISLGFSQNSIKETEIEQLNKLQNDTFEMQLEASRQITEFEIRNENIKEVKRENLYLKFGYLIIIIRYIAVGL